MTAVATHRGGDHRTEDETGRHAQQSLDLGKAPGDDQRQRRVPEEQQPEPKPLRREEGHGGGRGRIHDRVIDDVRTDDEHGDRQGRGDG